jgi:prevent-host-death family protein
MRRKVGLRELRAELPRILRRVSEEGEVVDITRHGRTIASIVPASGAVKLGAPRGSSWAEIDRLAAEIGRHWNPEATSASQAVSADRRG